MAPACTSAGIFAVMKALLRGCLLLITVLGIRSAAHAQAPTEADSRRADAEFVARISQFKKRLTDQRVRTADAQATADKAKFEVRTQERALREARDKLGLAKETVDAAEDREKETKSLIKAEERARKDARKEAKAARKAEKKADSLKRDKA